MNICGIIWERVTESVAINKNMSRLSLFISIYKRIHAGLEKGLCS